jgi:sorting nexin-1/2
MEDPWADSAGTSDPLGTSQQSSTDDGTTTATTTTTAAGGPTSSTTTTSSSARPSRLTPRRLVAQPTRLQAVEDDPLGPLGAPNTTTPPLPGDAASPAAGAAAGVGQAGGPPVPPLKEPGSTGLPLRTTMPPSSAAASAKKQADPHRIEGDDDDDDDNDNGERGGRVGGGGARPRQPPPVQAALPSPVRSAQHPSVSVEQAARPSFRIAVGDPHKVGDLTSSHIVYSVRTQVCF